MLNLIDRLRLLLPTRPVAAHVHETVLWAGRLRCTVRDASGHVVDLWEGENLITDAGKDLLSRGLINASLNTRIAYMAWGTSNQAPAAGDTQLVAEAGRKQVTQQSDLPADGEVLTTTYLAPQDGNVAIEELGWFAGDTATATPNSGVLVARTLYTLNKNTGISLQVDRTDDIG